MKKKLRLQLVLAVLLVCFGVAMITVAFLVPPSGQIDTTVLTAYGETLTFAGALMGLDYHYAAKYISKQKEDTKDDDEV